MGKKIIVLMLILMTSSLWATNDKAKKLAEEFNENDLIVEATVEEISTLYYFRERNPINQKTLYVEILKDDITRNNLGKVKVITKLTMKTVNSYKNRNKIKTFNIYLKGGKITVNNESFYQFTTHNAHPLWDIGDKLIVGVVKAKTSDRFSRMNSNFINGYHFINGKKFQIPSSKKIIEKQEKYKLEKAKNKVQSENIEDPKFFEKIEKNYLKAKKKMSEIIEERVEFTNQLKIELRRSYE